MVYDALEMSYRTIRIRKDPSTPKITELIDYDAFCGVVSDEAQDAAAGHTITAIELKEMIDAGKDFALIDVREQNEYEIVSIPGATLIPKDRILSGEALVGDPAGQAGGAALQVRARARPRRWPRCTRPGSATPCTSAAACSPGPSRSTPRCRPTESPLSPVERGRSLRSGPVSPSR